MVLNTDEVMNRVYVSDVKTKGSAIRAFSTRKAATNKIRGAYIVKIAGEIVFTVEEAKQVLQRLKQEGAKSVTIEFTLEKKLDSIQRRMVLKEQNLFTPGSTNEEGDYVHSLSVKDVRAIAAI